ncbi:MAG TPA: polysaccharide deacetylase family protein [Polyangiaceae bacterium]|nr:polysaccharide deacetylase family protein [Polyangiaceae bacterium]
MRLKSRLELGLPFVLSIVACSPASTSDTTATGGANGLGGSVSTTGGTSTGGLATGGTATGGVTTGGVSSGGLNTGGTGPIVTGGISSATGGTSSSGGSSGGNAQGGSGTGGNVATGGNATTGGIGGGKAGTGGNSSGGKSTGGAGGAATGGTSAGGTTSSGASKLPVPPGASDVPKPSGTPGNITVLNWAGFKAAVSYSFDDSNSTQIQHYAEMNALGVRFTFYMWTGKTDASNSIWATAVKDGHEIGNHTKSHSSNGTTDDITAATDFIKQKYGVDAYTMAAPNGAPVYTNLAKPLFLINRGVGNGLIGAGTSDNSDAYTLPTYIPPTGASTSAFNQQVDDARSAGKWRTMCIHGFQGGNDGAYQPVPFDQFIASVQHAKSLGDVWIDSIANVGAYWQGQKAVAQATSTTSGSDKTFTWKLPAHFPPGRYLRVKVDGGTLKQNGQALTWDSHGYYEIALDALSATLSP